MGGKGKRRRSTRAADAIALGHGASKIDENAKRILAESQFLARTLKGFSVECAEYSVEELISFIDYDSLAIGKIAVMPGRTRRKNKGGYVIRLNAEDSVPGEGRIFYDLRFDVFLPGKGDSSEKKLQMIINIEIQNDGAPGYPLTMRAVFYAARLLSAQNMSGPMQKNCYGQLKKVYTIWICTQPSKDRRGAVNVYALSEHHARGNYSEKKEHYDLLTVVMVYLDLEDVTLHGESDMEHAVTMLNTVFNDDLEFAVKKGLLEAQNSIVMTEETEGWFKEMGGLALGYLNHGIEKGMAQGMAQGRAQGIAEGMAQGRAQGMAEGMTQGCAEGMKIGALDMAKRTAMNLYNMGVSIDTIAQGVGCSVSEVKKWLTANEALS